MFTRSIRCLDGLTDEELSWTWASFRSADSDPDGGVIGARKDVDTPRVHIARSAQEAYDWWKLIEVAWCASSQLGWFGDVPCPLLPRRFAALFSLPAL
jgi:hypothetical protein